MVARGSLNELLKYKLPVRVSSQAAKLGIKLKEGAEVFEKVRDGLFATYEVNRKPGENGQIELTSNQEGGMEKFTEEFNELLGLEIEVVFEKVKLPEMIAATCDKCHHNMDKNLEIEGSILISLDKFIEV